MTLKTDGPLRRPPERRTKPTEQDTSPAGDVHSAPRLLVNAELTDIRGFTEVDSFTEVVLG